jgi:glycosyltransferase involved in cell wall biosynthesis
MKKLKVLILLIVPVEIMGSGVVVRHLIKCLRKKGHNVMLLTSHFMKKSNLELGLPEDIPVDMIIHDSGENSEIQDVSFPVPVFSAGLYFPSVRYKDMTKTQLDEFREVYSARITKAIHEFKPDVIHTNHLFLVNSLFDQGAPHIPIVCTCHGTEIKMLKEDGALLPLAVSAQKNVDRIIALSDENKKQVISMYGVDENKVFIVGNGYDASIFHPRNINKKEILKKYNIRGDF